MTYTEHEKVYFVEKMWDEGLRPATASRVWGRPSRGCLAEWERQALAGELPAAPPARPGRVESHPKHQRWPERTRREALRLLSLGWDARRVALALGIPGADTVGRWAARAREASMGAGVRAMRKGEGKGKGKGKGEARDEELERALLENAALREMLRDPKAGDPERLSNRQKAELCERLRRDHGFRLKDLLTFFRMSKSSYEYARRASPREDPEWLEERVRHAYEWMRGRGGYRKVIAAIRGGADGLPPAPAPERAVRRIMREGGMRARRGRRPPRWSSYAGEASDRPANVPRERALARRAAGGGFRLAHDFSADRPGALLATDVTEFSLNGFRLYLSPVLDLWDGALLSWSVSDRPDQRLCSSSLREALGRLPAGSAPVVHTDGGSCYRSGEWRAICEEAGATRSMSRKGRCDDNAVAEGFFGTLKQELLYSRSWDGVGEAEFREELEDYLRWYSEERLRAFVEGGKVVYETVPQHRERHDVKWVG
jgi:putative transposase